MKEKTKQMEQMEKLEQDINKIYGELLSVIDYDIQHHHLSYEEFYNIVKFTAQMNTTIRNLRMKIYDSKL